MTPKLNWAIRIYKANLKEYNKELSNLLIFKRSLEKEKVYYVV